MAVDPLAVPITTFEMDANPEGVPIHMLVFNFFLFAFTTDGIVNGYVMYGWHRPIRRVKVHLFTGGIITETTTTDASGQYIFSGVRTEGCKVQIVLPIMERMRMGPASSCLWAQQNMHSSRRRTRVVPV